MITISKLKTETTCLFRAKKAATVGHLSGLKRHHYSPHRQNPFQNTQYFEYFEKGFVVRDLNDVFLNR
jgi:hypothetical protein